MSFQNRAELAKQLWELVTSVPRLLMIKCQAAGLEVCGSANSLPPRPRKDLSANALKDSRVGVCVCVCGRR